MLIRSFLKDQVENVSMRRWLDGSLYVHQMADQERMKHARIEQKHKLLEQKQVSK